MSALPMIPTPFFSRLIVTLAATISSAAFTGCAVREAPLPQQPGDHVFIEYWGGAQQRGKNLRVAVKDLIDVRGSVTTAGAEYFEREGRPARQDAACLARIRRKGVTLVGKTNLTELALGVAGINNHFGTPKSPLNERRKLLPGGSSSGSAVAVATDFADVALGTDTAGSIRVPAAWCGIYGLKTTHGLVSLKGVKPISPKYLDTVGPMAKDIPRLVQGMDLLHAGFASRYAAAKARYGSGRAVTVGRLYVPGTDPDIDEAVDAALARSGFTVRKLGPEFVKQWQRAQAIAGDLAIADGWFYGRELLDKTGITPVSKAMIRLGEVQFKNGFGQMLEERRSWQRTMRSTLAGVDFIATPTVKANPPRMPFFGRSALFEDRTYRTQNTSPVNLAGNPAIAVPVPMEDDVVSLTSVQLIGRPNSEADLIAAARLLEPAKLGPIAAVPGSHSQEARPR